MSIRQSNLCSSRLTRAAAHHRHAQSSIEVAAGASATLIETHLGEGAYLANSVTEIRLGDGAQA